MDVEEIDECDLVMGVLSFVACLIGFLIVFAAPDLTALMPPPPLIHASYAAILAIAVAGALIDIARRGGGAMLAVSILTIVFAVGSLVFGCYIPLWISSVLLAVLIASRIPFAVRDILSRRRSTA